MIFVRKINKMPEFYTIFARKFFSEFCGASGPLLLSPTPMFVRLISTELLRVDLIIFFQQHYTTLTLYIVYCHC